MAAPHRMLPSAPEPIAALPMLQLKWSVKIFCSKMNFFTSFA
jgi:hypothetical protein